MAELPSADVRAHVALSPFTDFENVNVFKPGAHHEPNVSTMLHQVVAWGTARTTVRGG